MSNAYSDSKTSGTLAALFVAFTVMFTAGFGLMCWLNNNAHEAASHPQVQQSATMTNS